MIKNMILKTMKSSRFQLLLVLILIIEEINGEFKLVIYF